MVRPVNTAARNAIQRELCRGPRGATGLAAALKISPRTTLRLLAELGDATVSSGQAQRRRYAARRPLRGVAEALPVFALDEAGRVTEAAALHPIQPQGCLFPLPALGWPVDDDSRDGWWGGLPYPLYDMQPQGFLGRAFARASHADLEVPADPDEWGDDDVLHVLARRGEDCSGHLIVGAASLRRHQQQRLQASEPLVEAQIAPAYVAAATLAASQGLAGSSAGGAFPKFTARRALAGAATAEVIVKFSGVANAPATRRWADLLVCEHLALQRVQALGASGAAATRLVQAGGRTFLESERFDRVGAWGRRPLVSLRALSGHLLGLSSQDWRQHAARLVARGLIDARTVDDITRLWWFGRLIANNDMHLGNLSFHPQAGRLRLAPAYDMLPMAFTPLPGGEVPEPRWNFELPLPAERAAWLAAGDAAMAFWADAAGDARISPGFRARAAELGQLLNVSRKQA
ncbi:MAG: phosphatidylinositol kinase [Leptothrix sp. (in: Bacteria)]|nr:phosphatidylinositol kinase [Leptothrix sp. (in: b-proteobacteria)]